jgi:arginyl-tRNA synthetase
LLYTCVRIKSIIRKAEENKIGSGKILEPTDTERELVLLLLRLPEVLGLAALEYAPNHLCEYANTLAQAFNRFYGNCHILSEKDPQRQGSWLTLCRICLRGMELITGLLGIQVPEKM